MNLIKRFFKKRVPQINEYANYQAGDKTYKVLKNTGNLSKDDLLTYDKFLGMCVHVNKDGKLGSLPIGFIENHPELFEHVIE